MAITMWIRYQVIVWSIILNVCPFDYTAVAGSGKVGS